MKLVSVLPFTIAIWKLIEDISSDKNFSVESINPHQLAASCFAILPFSQFDRVRRTQKWRESPHFQKEVVKAMQENKISYRPSILHQLVCKNPEAVIRIIKQMNKEWPSLWIPQIANHEGTIPLKLAVENKHRRVIGWLLDHLKDYPMGYCQHKVPSLISQLITQSFESKVGQYLNNRFISPQWTSTYQIAHLNKGLNLTTTQNWPAKPRDMERKFFHREQPSVPVKFMQLDCADLHINDQKKAIALFLSLKYCNISIFSHKSVQLLVEYVWLSAWPVIIKWLLIPFLVYLITYMTYLQYLFSDRVEALSGFQMRIFNVIQVLLLILAFYFIQLHFRQLRLHNYRICSVAFFWNICDMIPLIANLISIYIEFVNKDEPNDSYREAQRPLYAVASIFLWIKVFYFLRIFRDIGHLVLMIFDVIYQMRFFFIVLFCCIIAFATAFYALTEANHGWVTQLWFVFNITIRKSETKWIDEGYKVLLFSCFVAASMFFTYIMLNLTVSMVKGFYDANMRIKTEQAYMVMTQLILDCFHYIPKSVQERALCPDREISDEYVISSIDPVFDPFRNFFRVKLRENCFGKQYLITAEPVEIDEAEQLKALDQEKLLLEIKKQVGLGLRQIQRELVRMEDMIAANQAYSSQIVDPHNYLFKAHSSNAELNLQPGKLKHQSNQMQSTESPLLRLNPENGIGGSNGSLRLNLQLLPSSGERQTDTKEVNGTLRFLPSHKNDEDELH